MFNTCKNGHVDVKRGKYGQCLACSKEAFARAMIKPGARAKHNAASRVAMSAPDKRARHNATNAKIRAAYKELGMCVSCNRNPVKLNCVACQSCLDYVHAIENPKRRSKMYAPISQAEQTEIKLLYKIARRVSLETGIPHEVDHIKPISKGGLHVYSNLQLLTKAANAAKGARYG